MHQYNRAQRSSAMYMSTGDLRPSSGHLVTPGWLDSTTRVAQPHLSNSLSRSMIHLAPQPAADNNTTYRSQRQPQFQQPQYRPTVVQDGTMGASLRRSRATTGNWYPVDDTVSVFSEPAFSPNNTSRRSVGPQAPRRRTRETATITRSTRSLLDVPPSRNGTGQQFFPPSPVSPSAELATVDPELRTAQKAGDRYHISVSLNPLIAANQQQQQQQDVTMSRDSYSYTDTSMSRTASRLQNPTGTIDGKWWTNGVDQPSTTVVHIKQEQNGFVNAPISLQPVRPRSGMRRAMSTSTLNLSPATSIMRPPRSVTPAPAAATDDLLYIKSVKSSSDQRSTTLSRPGTAVGGDKDKVGFDVEVIGADRSTLLTTSTSRDAYSTLNVNETTTRRATEFNGGPVDFTMTLNQSMAMNYDPPVEINTTDEYETTTNKHGFGSTERGKGDMSTHRRNKGVQASFPVPKNKQPGPDDGTRRQEKTSKGKPASVDEPDGPIQRVPRVVNLAPVPRPQSPQAPAVPPAQPRAKLRDQGVQATVSTRSQPTSNDDLLPRKLNTGIQASVTTRNQSIGHSIAVGPDTNNDDDDDDDDGSGGGITRSTRRPVTFTEKVRVLAQPDRVFEDEAWNKPSPDTKKPTVDKQTFQKHEFDPRQGKGKQPDSRRNDDGIDDMLADYSTNPAPSQWTDRDTGTKTFVNNYPDDYDDSLHQYAAEKTPEDTPDGAWVTRTRTEQSKSGKDFNDNRYNTPVDVDTTQTTFQSTQKPRSGVNINRTKQRQPVDDSRYNRTRTGREYTANPDWPSQQGETHFGYQGPRSKYIETLMRDAPQGSVTQWEHTEKEEEEIVGPLPGRSEQSEDIYEGPDAMLNYDSVSEKVDLSVSDGMATVTVTVRCERIVPVRGGVADLFKKTSVIVTKVIEVDLTVTEDRRQLYEQILAGQSKSTSGRLSKTDTFDLYQTFMGLAAADDAAGRSGRQGVQIDSRIDEQDLLGLRLNEINGGGRKEFRRIDGYLRDVDATDVDFRSRGHGPPIQSRTVLSKKRYMELN